MIEKNVVSVQRDNPDRPPLDSFYCKGTREEIKQELLSIENITGKPDTRNNACNVLSLFLTLKPGDMLAVKSFGRPQGLEIVAYVRVVERDGRVYYEDMNSLGHCINVEFLEKNINNEHKGGGFGRTIQEIKEEKRKEFFGKWYKPIKEKIYAEALDKLKKIEANGIKDMKLFVENEKKVIEEYGELFARKNLDNLTAERVKDFLSFKNNRHWKNIHRHGDRITKDMEKLKKHLKLVLDDNIPIAKRLDDSSYQITGLAKATLTPILLVTFPNKYGVWNDKSQSVLEKLGLWSLIQKDKATFGEQYKELNFLLNRLAKDLDTTLWVLDGLLFVLYQQFNDIEHSNFISEELSKEEKGKYPVGGKKQIIVNAYERNPKARQKCLDCYGFRCFVCNLSFGETYGNEFKKFIHVHHRKPVSEMPDKYEVDPIKDLIPVCPNCHAVIHYGKKTRNTEEVKKMLKK